MAVCYASFHAAVTVFPLFLMKRVAGAGRDAFEDRWAQEGHIPGAHCEDQISRADQARYEIGNCGPAFCGTDDPTMLAYGLCDDLARYA